MKPTLRSALGFAVACFVGVATATPMAQWIDFTGGTDNGNNSTSFTIEASGWTLTATGKKNTDGSVTLSSPATLSGTGMSAFSVILDCSKPAPTVTSRLLSFAISSTESNTVGFLNCSNTSVLQLGYGSGTGTLQTGSGSTYTLGATTRQFITLTHRSANDDPKGTYIYVDRSQALDWSGLRWTSNGNGLTYPHLTVGFNGLTVYGIYLYNSRLADEAAVSNELTIIDEIKAAYTATITAGTSVAADALDVSDGTTTKKLSAVTNTEAVRLTLAGDATISGTVTAKYLQTTGTGTLTFSEGTLSATSAWVDADVDVSAKALNASLGAVSIAAGNTLTVGASGEPYTTLTAGSASSTVSPVSKLTINAAKENFEATESQRAQLRAFTGVVEFVGTSGSDATGATLTYGSISNGYNNGFKPRFVFNKGQHTLAYGYGASTAKGNVRWSEGATDAAPTIEVTGGAQLTFKVKDVSGWDGSTGGTPSVLRVGEDSQLILTTLSKDGNGYSNATGYWRDRIVLDRGATVSVEAFTTSNGANNFVLYGGAGESDLPQLAMLDNQGEAIWNGGFRTDKRESRISIGTNSSLLLNGAITGEQAISKVGAGRLTLTGTNTNSGNLTIAAGTVRFAAAEGVATVGSWAGTVTVNDGATLEVPETAALPRTLASDSAGTVLLTGDGELDMRSAISTASALKAGFAEGSTGTLIVPAGSEAANLQVPAGATLKLVLSAAQLAAGRYTYSFTQAEGSTVSFWRADAVGNLTEVTGTTEGSTFLPTLSFVFTNAMRNGQWTDVGNWLNREVPSATDAVEIPADTALTLTENVSVASLRVTGSGTLTVTGGTLTVTNTLFVLERLVATSSQLVFGNDLVAINLPEAESALDYTVTGSAQVKLPALTGSGTFTKYGTGTESNALLFKDATTAYLAPIVVAEGVFSTGELQTDQEFHITVNKGATFLTKSTTSLTSTVSTLCLKGGAILDLRNGTGTRDFRAAITVDATADAPAIIQGSRNGNNSNLQGAITGKGTLEIRKAPDQTDANAFTISGIISDASEEEPLALKVTQTGGEAAVTLTGNNTYTGGTTIADRATVIVETIGKLGPRGTVRVEDGGRLKLVNSDTLNEEGTDYSRVTGTGTVWYSGSAWRTLPNTEANRLPTSISVRNDLTEGLIISQQGTDSPETAVGSVSGSGTFRVDGNGDNNSRSLRIVQSKNTEHTGNFIHSSENGRLTKVIVAGADGATEKTLTLSGNTTTTARPLEIESSGSVKLTGSWEAAITINGALEVPVESNTTKTISTNLAGTGTLTKSGAGQLDLTGANTFSGKVAITGGILNVGSNRGFTVSAIASGAKLALSPTATELENGKIALSMADGVTLSAEQLEVTDYPGVTGAGGYIYLSNPCWMPTAGDAAWEHNWYRGMTAIATAPTSGEIEVNFSALTAETKVTIPEGAFDAVTFVGGEAEGCSLVVTLGEGVTLGALTVSGQVTLPDTAIAAATEITAGATLSLAGSGATISTAITGAGSLCQRSGSTTLTGANTYTGTTTVAEGAKLSLAGEGVLSDAFGDGSAVVVNGTLELAAGSYCRRTMGEGTIRVLNDQTFAIGQAALPNGETWSADKTTGLTGFTGTLALVGNFELRNAGPAEYTYAPAGFNVRFEADSQGSSDGQLISASATSPVQAVLAAGCTLSGHGFVKCPIAFKADSVIEVTMATNLDLSEATITLPSGEGKHILLKAAVDSGSFLSVAPSANVPASVFDFASDSALKAADAGVKVYRYGDDDLVQVFTNPPVPTGTPNGVAAAIRDQAYLDGMPVTVQVVTKDEKKPKVKLEGALFFENVVATAVDLETYQVTAKVTYDFGVSAITVKKLTLAGTPELCVVVCAKVESSAVAGTPAIFKESAQVQLLLDDKVCDGTAGNGPLAYALTNDIDSSVNDGDKSVRWFAVPLSSLPTTGTNAFTVKVTE